MLNIGFIGLGIMGKPMAHHFLRAGYPLAVYARRQEIITEFAQAGAMICCTPKAVAEKANVIFTIVGGPADVEEIILGSEGIIQGAAPHSIIIDMTTSSCSSARYIANKLAEKNIDMLDAPVSGGEQGAIDGTLSIMVGGKANVVEKIQPLFAILGKQTVHVGDHGAGQIAKACNQIVIAQTIVAVTEALQLAKKANVDPAKVRQALLGGFANSKVLDVHGQRILDDNFKPGFKAVLHQKDMRLALEEANKLGVALPGAAFANQLLNVLVAEGQGELDSSALATILARLNS